jgi:hypothetical protein
LERRQKELEAVRSATPGFRKVSANVVQEIHDALGNLPPSGDPRILQSRVHRQIADLGFEIEPMSHRIERSVIEPSCQKLIIELRLRGSYDRLSSLGEILANDPPHPMIIRRLHVEPRDRAWPPGAVVADLVVAVPFEEFSQPREAPLAIN